MADARSTIHEVYAISSNRTRLSDTLTQVVELSWLSTALYQAGFITSELKASILTETSGNPIKVCKLLDAVEIQVHYDPTKYEAFIGILRTQPALSNTVEQLQSTLASRRTTSALELNNHLKIPTNKREVLSAKWLSSWCQYRILLAAFIILLALVVARELRREHYSSYDSTSHSSDDSNSKSQYKSEIYQKHSKQYKSDTLSDRLLQQFKTYISEGKIEEADQLVEQNISSLLDNQTVTWENRKLFGILFVFFMKHSKLQQVIETENKLIDFFKDSVVTTMHDRCMLASLAAHELSLQNYSGAAELSLLVSETLIKFRSSDHVYSTIEYWYIAIFSQFTMGKAMISSGRKEEGFEHINEATTLAFYLADRYLTGSACGVSLVSVLCEYVPVSMQHGQCIWRIFQQIYIGVITLINQTKTHSLVPDSQIVYKCACGKYDPYGATIDPLKWDTSAVVPTTVHILYHSYWYLSMLDVIIPNYFPINMKFLIKAFCHGFVFLIIFLCIMYVYFVGTVVFILTFFHLMHKLYLYVSCCRCFLPVTYICKGLCWLAFTCPFVLLKIILYNLLVPLRLCYAYMYILCCVYYISHLEKHKKTMIYKESSDNGALIILLLFGVGGVASHILLFCCKMTLSKFSFCVVRPVTDSFLWHSSCKIMHNVFIKLSDFLVIIIGRNFLYTVLLYSLFVGILAMCYCEAAYSLLTGAAERIDVVMSTCIALLFLRCYAFPIIIGRF